MKKYYLLALGGLLFFTSYGQISRFSGLNFDDDSYNKIPVKSFYTGKKIAELPLKVTLKPYCPVPGNQNDMLSCVGWAIGYGAMTIQYAIQNKVSNIEFLTQKAFSALFIYNQIKRGDCRSGSTIADAMKFLKKNGNCYAKDFDLHVKDCTALPSPSLKNWAQQFLIKDYKTLFSVKETEYNKKISQIKRALSEQKPIVVGMKVLQNFYDLKGADFWWPDIGNTSPAGGHAMVVIGYDEMKQSIQLMNSWGQDWGNKGFIWMKYPVFAKYCKYAFIMNLKTLKKEKNIKFSLDQSSHLSTHGAESKIQLMYLDRNSKQRFMPANVTFENGIYKSIRKWKIGQLFQLRVNPPLELPWIYVFSVENNGKSSVHKIIHVKEYTRKAIIIPDIKRALHLEKEGKDYLCILFSKTEIKDFSDFIKNGIKNPLNLKGDLKKYFAKRLVEDNTVFYHSNKIDFRVKKDGLRKIIYTILEVEGVSNN